jgi:hypothetical protein
MSLRTVKAIIDEQGGIRLLESISLPAGRSALVTILEDETLEGQDSALLSEPALGDWGRPEEDAAWSHLQQER